MPVSKHNNLYFTAEQKALADQNSSALQYALSQGYNLVQHGNYYVMREHDSMVFKLDGSWFWNSRRLHGRAAEFIMHYEGKSFVEAVLTLAGEGSAARAETVALPSPAPPVSFHLPEPAPSQEQMYGYLCGTRRLEPRILRTMVNQKILYQSDRILATGKVVHNVCFVSYDQQGRPCSAFQRGTSAAGPGYKGEVPGGDKKFGWILHGESPRRLYVFEAAIDAASYASLRLREGKDPLKGADYLAMGGLIFQPIQTYLNCHPEVRAVRLLLDNDGPGRTAAADFLRRLEASGVEAEIQLPPRGKDWNEYLQSTYCKEKDAICAPHSRPPCSKASRPVRKHQLQR